MWGSRLGDYAFEGNDRTEYELVSIVGGQEEDSTEFRAVVLARGESYN
jgi:hypothetical protein